MQLINNLDLWRSALIQYLMAHQEQSSIQQDVLWLFTHVFPLIGEDRVEFLVSDSNAANLERFQAVQDQLFVQLKIAVGMHSPSILKSCNVRVLSCDDLEQLLACYGFMMAAVYLDAYKDKTPFNWDVVTNTNVSGCMICMTANLQRMLTFSSYTSAQVNKIIAAEGTGYRFTFDAQSMSKTATPLLKAEDAEKKAALAEEHSQASFMFLGDYLSPIAPAPLPPVEPRRPSNLTDAYAAAFNSTSAASQAAAQAANTVASAVAQNGFDAFAVAQAAAAVAAQVAVAAFNAEKAKQEQKAEPKSVVFERFTKYEDLPPELRVPRPVQANAQPQPQPQQQNTAKQDKPESRDSVDMTATVADMPPAQDEGSSEHYPTHQEPQETQEELAADNAGVATPDTPAASAEIADTPVFFYAVQDGKIVAVSNQLQRLQLVAKMQDSLQKHLQTAFSFADLEIVLRPEAKVANLAFNDAVVTVIHSSNGQQERVELIGQSEGGSTDSQSSLAQIPCVQALVSRCLQDAAKITVSFVNANITDLAQYGEDAFAAAANEAFAANAAAGVLRAGLVIGEAKAWNELAVKSGLFGINSSVPKRLLASAKDGAILQMKAESAMPLLKGVDAEHAQDQSASSEAASAVTAKQELVDKPSESQLKVTAAQHVDVSLSAEKQPDVAAQDSKARATAEQDSATDVASSLDSAEAADATSVQQSSSVASAEMAAQDSSTEASPESVNTASADTVGTAASTQVAETGSTTIESEQADPADASAASETSVDTAETAPQEAAATEQQQVSPESVNTASVDTVGTAASAQVAETGTTTTTTTTITSESEQAEPSVAIAASTTSVDTAETAPQETVAAESQAERPEAVNTAPQAVADAAASAQAADTGTTAIEAEQAEPPVASAASANSVDSAETASQEAVATEQQQAAPDSVNAAPQAVAETAASAQVADTGSTAIEAEQAEPPAQAAVIAPANKTSSAFGYKPNPCIALWDEQKAAMVRAALNNLAKDRYLEQQIDNLVQLANLPRISRDSLRLLDQQPYDYDLQAPFITLPSYAAFTVEGFYQLHGNALTVYEREPNPQQCNPDYYAQKSDLELFELAASLVDVTRCYESNVYCGSQERALPHKDEVAACMQAFNWRINDLLEDKPLVLLRLVDYFKLEEIKLPHVLYQFFGVDKYALLSTSQNASQPVEPPRLRSKLLERIGLPRRLDSKLLERSLGRFAHQQNSNEMAGNHDARLHDLQQNFPAQYAQISAQNATNAKTAEQNVAAHNSAAPLERISQMEMRLTPYWKPGAILYYAWHEIIKVWREASNVWRKEGGVAAAHQSPAFNSQPNFGNTATVSSSAGTGFGGHAQQQEHGSDLSLQKFARQHDLDALAQLSASCEQARKHAEASFYGEVLSQVHVNQEQPQPQSLQQPQQQLHPQAQYGFYAPDGAFIQEPPLDFATPLPDEDAGQFRRLTAEEEYFTYSHHYEPPRKTEAHLRKCRDFSVVTAQRQAQEMNIKSPPADFHDDDMYVYGPESWEPYAQSYQGNAPQQEPAVQQQGAQQQCAQVQQSAAYYEQQAAAEMPNATAQAATSSYQDSASQEQAVAQQCAQQQFAQQQTQTAPQQCAPMPQNAAQYGQGQHMTAATPVNGVAQSATSPECSDEGSCDYLPPQSALAAVGQGHAPQAQVQAQAPYPADHQAVQPAAYSVAQAAVSPAAQSSSVAKLHKVCQLFKPVLSVHRSSLSARGKFMSVEQVAQEFDPTVAAMSAFMVNADDKFFWQKAHIVEDDVEIFMYQMADEDLLCAQRQRANAQQSQLGKGANRNAGGVPYGVNVDCKHLPLDPNMTLDSFWLVPAPAPESALVPDPASENTKVWSVLSDFASKGWGSNNLVCLSGVSGSGKTHLVQGFIHDLNRDQPAKSVLYISAQNFTQYYKAIYCEKSKANNKGYFDARSLCSELFDAYDVVVVEDIHTFKVGNKAPQTFMDVITERVMETNKLLILTSKLPLDQLQGTSFEKTELLLSGLVEELHPLSLQARTSFLSNRLHLMGYDNLTEDMVQYICASIGSSMYEVKGVLTKIATHLKTQDVVTMDRLDSLIEAYRTEKPRKPKIEDVQRVVAKHFLVGVDEMLSSERTKAISWARTMAMRIVRDGLQEPYRKIAEAFHKDPRSVRDAMARTSKSFIQDAATLQDYLSLMASLGLRVPPEVLRPKS